MNSASPRAPGPVGVSLERRLGPLDAAAIVVSNVIGSGIFFVPMIVAQLIPSGPGILLVWLVGGALAFAGAMAYAELAALRPKAGGEYVYLHEAFGPLAAFLSGWTSFVAGFSGAIAASAIALSEYLGRFLPFAEKTAPILALRVPESVFGSPVTLLSISPQTLVALGVIATLTLAHLRGLGPGRVVQNVLASTKVSALLVFLVLGFALGHGSGAAPVAAAAVSTVPFGLTGMLVALVPVMFTYSGWNAASYVAEEVRSPGRNVPLALGLGTGAVIVLYLGLNLLFLFALPVGELARLDGRLLDTVAERLFGFEMANLAAAFTIVSIAAGVSAMVLAGPRVYFAMARDGLFAAPAGQVHPRFRSPTRAIIAQAVWSGVLVLSGSLQGLVSYTGFAVVLFSAVAVSAVFVLRKRHPDADRPFHAWGYPWAPALFVTASALIVVNEVWRNPRPSAAGIAVIAAGLPVYWMLKRSKKTRA